MALKATIRRAVRQAFEALDDIPRKATYRSVTGAAGRDLDTGTSTVPTVTTELPMTAWVRFSSKDQEKDPLIVLDDVKVIFPSEDLPHKSKTGDLIVDDEGLLWEVKRQLNDPASIVYILQCKAA